MRSERKRKINKQALGTFSFSDLAEGFQNTVSTVQDKINTFTEENPQLANIIKTGGTQALIDLQRQGVITQETLNKLLGTQGTPPPPTQSISPVLIGTIAFAVIGGFLYINSKNN